MRVTIKDIKDAPNLQELKDKFGVSEETLIVAYGDTIYCPPVGMSKDLMVHEMKHCERQGFARDSARRWWERYMGDPEFRLSEEVEAYKAQYRFCKAIYKDRNRQAKILFALAKELASPMYGSIIKHSEAMKKICG